MVDVGVGLGGNAPILGLQNTMERPMSVLGCLPLLRKLALLSASESGFLMLEYVTNVSSIRGGCDGGDGLGLVRLLLVGHIICRN